MREAASVGAVEVKSAEASLMLASKLLVERRIAVDEVRAQCSSVAIPAATPLSPSFCPSRCITKCLRALDSEPSWRDLDWVTFPSLSRERM